MTLTYKITKECCGGAIAPLDSPGVRDLDDRIYESCHNGEIHLVFRAPIQVARAIMDRVGGDGGVAVVIELSLGGADTAKLRSTAQARTEPASRVKHARILLTRSPRITTI
jgi:hypothetical protein